MFGQLIPDVNLNEVLFEALRAIWKVMPVWLPIFLLVTFVQTWMRYMRTKWISEQKFVLLELKVPKEIEKSPAAMEIVLIALYQTGTGSLLDVYLKGRTRFWSSLELVSIGGQVHFYIWTSEKLRNTIESQIYSQYPTVEIHEVPDYSLGVLYDPDKISIRGAQMILSKKDAYPIKTYIDYGLNKDPKEEYKIDPLTAVIEYLGSLKPGEQSWIQILIRAHKSEGLKEVRLFKKPDWTKAAKEEIKKVAGDSLFKPEEGKGGSFIQLTEMQRETITAIERSISKFAFDASVRMIYLAEKEAFNPVNIGGLLGSFKQFNSNTLNGFKRSWGTEFDYPWEDFRKTRERSNERKILDAYKRRSFFHPPYKNFHAKPFILTTEELATIFHFPGLVSTTPTFSRLVSRKAEPPPNLPL
jgi:hypothetical protein